MNRKPATLLALGLLAGSSPAAAQTWYNRSTCSPGGLKICAAISAASVQTGSQWQIRLKVWNLFDGTAANGLSYALTAVGLYAASWSGNASLSSATF